MMQRLAGEVERRLLVNYRVDPDVLAGMLPPPFRPQLVEGAGVAGICLIRLGGMRPAGLPAWVGRRSENAAHRIAVEWDTDAGPRTGVYIPRRDSDSRLNVLVGGRAYPGQHHLARFEVEESDESLRVAFAAQDGTASVDVSVRLTEDLLGSSLFPTLARASAFFEKGAVGYSATDRPGRHEGLELRTDAWRVEPAEILSVRSTFFDDPVAFPVGTAELDCALAMRHVPVEWHALAPLTGNATTAP